MDRKPARWMCTLDERIIEYLDEDAFSTPRHMERVIKFNASRRRIRERCQLLTRAGLIAPVYEGDYLYEITEKGRGYLVGDIDVEHLPQPSPRVI
jgi:hypothetical protein